MTLQQLRYAILVAETGSMNMAARRAFVTQPSLSRAVADLEQEMGIAIFHRTNKGVMVSEEGAGFLAYARQVLDQAQLLEERYKHHGTGKVSLAISSQHYAFVVNAFVELVKEYGSDKYEFTLREARTNDIIEDVRERRSELGILYLSHFNQEVISRLIHNHDLEFTTLFQARPHVFVSRKNPLSKQGVVHLSDLRAYPRLTYEQGISHSFYFSEELHSTAESPKNIIVSDRATLFNLLIGLNGYTISSGILSSDLNGSEIVSIELDSRECMEIGYIRQSGMPLSPMASAYLEHLMKYIEQYRRQ